MARKNCQMPTGRIELVNWLNDFLEVELTKVEQCSDGIAYAQIIDCASGLRIPLYKFNFAARNEDDYARNLNLLQVEFKKLSIEHPVPVDKLKKGRFQDNNEFLQWCFAYLHNCVDEPLGNYDAALRRQEALQRQVRSRTRGMFPPPCIKPELACGVDLEAPIPPPRSSGTTAGPSHYDPGTAYSSHRSLGVEEPDADLLMLSTALADDLYQERLNQARRKKGLERLAKERNAMWQQLRTIEELLGNLMNSESTNVISEILFEQDTRLS